MSLPPLSSLPAVSVVFPVRNEAAHLRDSVRAVLASGYRGEVEVVVAVAPSTDGTETVAAALADDARITMVDNPTGRTPDGLNAAIAAARHDVIVRMDGHALMPRGYIDLAIDALRSTGAGNVGGRMVPEGQQPFQRAVAVAMSSVWGLGGAGHRQGGTAGRAESVYLGSFRREALEDVGGYDPHYVRAQDWELNMRLREAGYLVWFVPQMQVPYFPRATWRDLATQFWRTGQWRREVIRRHPQSRSLRYFAAPVVTVAVAAGLALGVVGVLAGIPALAWTLIIPGGYALGVLGASAVLASRAGSEATMRMPLVLATMHLAWGGGFLRGVRDLST
ncbi:glycosyltransferase family 2 protein [Demequina sp. NBRC 110055]|uniref:glycosyltransferase family 2 protein n=1 Tax=Demequina sp. NBRC 110055 TaxID=1570344 RepID=UPI000A053C6D|nr:glycosyltransferase family 2 protein [Demequina sp. NBRC 110055]